MRRGGLESRLLLWVLRRIRFPETIGTRSVFGHAFGTVRVRVVAVYLRRSISFILRLPLPSDPFRSRQLVFFLLILREDDDVTEPLVEFLLQLREVLPLGGDQAAFLQGSLTALHSGLVV